MVAIDEKNGIEYNKLVSNHISVDLSNVIDIILEVFNHETRL